MRNRWSDREAAEFQARYEPEWGAEVALAAYSGHLLREDYGVSQTSVAVKDVHTNVLGESVRTLFVLENALPAEPAMLDLSYLQKLRALRALPPERAMQELRTHLLQVHDRALAPETLAHAFLPMEAYGACSLHPASGAIPRARRHSRGARRVGRPRPGAASLSARVRTRKGYRRGL